ncbi:uncharacterized protein [Venturia canescens]|uniref:uncharacterized protein n=1 Tax=Venturia canescens TaxID=32260 RepID=UPI001C9D4A6C|nr:uncharacterized protein LOC122416101 [Venturia canescens]
MDRGRDSDSSEGSIESEETKFADEPQTVPDKPVDYSKYYNEQKSLFPELYRSDVSIHPSYTGLKTLPFYVISRRRAARKKRQMTRQLNWEILHMAMMQSYALAGVRVDRIFSLGYPPKSTNVPDFATSEERLRINQLIFER